MSKEPLQPKGLFLARDGLMSRRTWMFESDLCTGSTDRKLLHAFPALPPSMAVVCRGRRDAQERLAMDGLNMAAG
ncbi:hypothetical protein BOW51_07790 [Solemya velesiana gill symbiont]|uniref:Uncharacterized protein n=1 Tax=Solemya velesiana gill symbiont TaxID=1918948 RepID=A0A1T2KTW4_9GAMM|nr:hypothetical protein BOW51_07790 [Solemya velesiana gill symbiont]